MKECPRCGAVSYDDQLWCENCGFDPDFDGGSWNNGGSNPSVKPYIHGEHIKSKSNDDMDGIICFIAIVVISMMAVGFISL